MSTLRKIYGQNFAADFQPHQKLSDVLSALDDTSLSQLVRDHEANQLHSRIAQAS